MTKRFSERLGIVDHVQTIQTEGMSDALRNSLWNYVHSLFNSPRWDHWKPLAMFVAQFFRKVPVDELPYQDYECRKWLKAYFYSLEWYEVYDLIEFLVSKHQHIDGPHLNTADLEKTFNAILATELSGFRFIAGVIAPISNPSETEAVVSAMEAAKRSSMPGVYAHIETALKLLGRKPNPDYRNSIKESISAVESIAKQISSAESQGLSGAMQALDSHIPIHGALKQGFINLYGYSSDADGIRHAILDEPNVGFDEAKYMLVSCSAFVHYLISKANGAGVLGKFE